MRWINYLRLAPLAIKLIRYSCRTLAQSRRTAPRGGRAVVNGVGGGILVRPITFTRMFEPRHNILSNVRANVRKYVVTRLEHSA